MAVHVATDDLIAFLNSLLEIDRKWLTALVNDRVDCNEQLAYHPTVQVRSHIQDAIYYNCGVLGLLNGFCGIIDSGPKKGWGPITAVIGEDGVIKWFVRTTDSESRRS